MYRHPHPHTFTHTRLPPPLGEVRLHRNRHPRQLVQPRDGLPPRRPPSTDWPRPFQPRPMVSPAPGPRPAASPTSQSQGMVPPHWPYLETGPAPMDGLTYRSHPAVGPHPQAPRRGWFRPAGSRPAHLVRGHLAHGAVGLHGLQLFETPVQLLQCLPGQLLTCLFWRRGSTGGDPEAPARDDGGPPGERGAGKGQLRQPPQVKGPPPPTGAAREALSQPLGFVT